MNIKNLPAVTTTTDYQVVLTSAVIAKQKDVEEGTPLGKYKMRNSCFSGHHPDQLCLWCGAAQLNKYTTGYYADKPSDLQLIEFAGNNDLRKVVVGNMPLSEFLKKMTQISSSLNEPIHKQLFSHSYAALLPFMFEDPSEVFTPNNEKL